MIFVEDYGDLNKYINTYEDYKKFIGKFMTIYTAAGNKFSGVLCIDSGDRLMLISNENRTQNARQNSIIIFKRHIAAIEMPLDEQ